MTKLSSLICTLATALLLCSCETDVPVSNKNDNQLVVFALAVTGQKIDAYISHSLPIEEGERFTSKEEGYGQGNPFKIHFKKELFIADAQVTLDVNSQSSYGFHLSDDSAYFVCDYIPKPGDKLQITVAADGYQTCYASTEVPAVAPEIQNLSYSLYYDQAVDPRARSQMYSMIGRDEYGADSLMNISFDFNDQVNERNYYRLDVRNVAVVYRQLSGRKYWNVRDSFTSFDPYFYDAELTKGWGNWDAYISNVFEDHLFNGQDCKVNVTTRPQWGNDVFTIVMLQAITKDLFYFQRSVQLYRISHDAFYSTPVGIYSNVTNGWGIFGAATGTDVTIRFK